MASLKPRGEPGQYELTYVPASGKAGAVAMQVMRPGTRARGLTEPVMPTLDLQTAAAPGVKVEFFGILLGQRRRDIIIGVATLVGST